MAFDDFLIHLAVEEYGTG